MKKSTIVGIAALIAGAVVVIDHPSTVGVKSLAVALLPVPPERKAEMVRRMCERALPTPPLASLTCFGANASDAWLQAYKTQKDFERDAASVCRMVIGVLTAGKGETVSGARVVSDEGTEARLITTDGSFISVDRAEKTVTILSGGRMTAIDCPAL